MTTYHVTLKNYPLELRPRERLKQVGVESLSDTELLAILLSTGSGQQTALELAGNLLNYPTPAGLRTLATLTLEELCQFVGMGLAKATRILAALELGKRLSLSVLPERPTIKNPSDVASILAPRLMDKQQEYFVTLLLDTKNRVIAQNIVTIGTLNSTLVHPREVFRNAIAQGAHALVVAHNHPSGDPEPSEEDIHITKRLIQCGALMELEVLDHVIIGDHTYISLRERTQLWTHV